ncbi:porin family protein [uncultured Lacinutrix sp.]|uniref:porin family protein n=1 Tax=uncultured Lacinutrix sp. TaxID=574032 RepID=UPI002626A634|nr:porin family protein [uncultured Lacinutrix sp.]
MKKSSITVLLFFLTMLSVYAQQEEKSNSKKITYGLKGGLNLSTPNGYLTDNTESKLSFHLGAFAEIILSDKFAIQPELQYSIQGAEVNIKTTALGNFTVSDTYEYINIPIMVKYFITEKFNVEVGPQIGYLLNAERDYDIMSSSNLSSLNNITKDVERIDFGLNFGLGYKLSKHLNVGVRYNLGLSKVVNSPAVTQPKPGKLKNSVFQASIGYSF